MTAPRKAAPRKTATTTATATDNNDDKISFTQTLVVEKLTPGSVRFRATEYPSKLDTLYLRKQVLDQLTPGVDLNNVHIVVTIEVHAND
jgi:hypothetical protein